jgi:hypothetical protein
MERAGFDVESFPWMSDRGNLLAAATILKGAKGLILLIKFCLEHIIRNVVHNFKIGKDKLGRLCTTMSAIQASFEFRVYARATGWKITVYLMSIHPHHWVVFANRKDLANQAWMSAYPTRLQVVVGNLAIEVPDDLAQDHCRFIDCTLPIGKKFPLFLILRSNMSEGGTSHVNGLGIRSLTPLFALDRFLLNFKKSLANCTMPLVGLEEPKW